MNECGVFVKAIEQVSRFRTALEESDIDCFHDLRIEEQRLVTRS